MVRPMRIVVWCSMAAAVWGCAASSHGQVIYSIPSGVAWQASAIDQWIRAHPLPPGQPLRLDEVSRTASASLHVAQIRGAEPPHIHREHDLVAVVRSGTGLVQVGAQTYWLGPGDVIEIPRGVRHFAANRGSEPLVAVVVISPPFDGYDVVPQD